jgi:NitT/TauT family transport system substrate-binding protein
MTCCSGGKHGPSSPGTREAISIGVPREALGTLVIIAQEKGFFADAGLEVKVVDTYPSGKRALQGMLDGEVNLTISSEVPLVFRSFERDDFCILATIGTSDNEPRVIARMDHGVEKPADLGGKRIATQRASAVHYFLHLLLLKHGIADAQLEFMKAEELPQALADGRIDAFCMREPFTSEARHLVGDNAIVFQEPGMYLKTMNLVSLKRLLSERPKAVEKVLRALVRAEEFYRDHREETLKSVADNLQTDVQQLGELLDDVELEVTLSHALVVALEDEARWAIENAFTETQDTPDFQKLMSVDAMRAVKPAAVTVID